MNDALYYRGLNMRDKMRDTKRDIRKNRDLPSRTAEEIWKAASMFLERASRVFGVHTE
jgi:hypothetical protein